MKKRIGLVLVILMVTGALVFGQSASRVAPPPSTGKVTVEIFDRGSDGGRSQAHNNAWTKWVQDKVKKDLGIDVTFQPVGRWSENTDIVNLMAAQSAPDLCYTYNTNMVWTFRDQGGLLELSSYIDTYLPDLKKLLGADPAFARKDFIRRYTETRSDIEGKIFAIPSARIAIAQRNVFIRKDWLDKLKIAVPRNINQYYNALTAFKKRAAELPGGLTPNTVVPLGVNDDVRWGLADFMNNSITRNLSDKDRWRLGVAERNLALPGYKDGVKLMNKWYNEGLIYQDFALMTTADDLYNMMKRGVVGSFSQNWDMPYRTAEKINEELRKNVPGAEFIPIDLGLNNKDLMDKVGLQIFIPSFSKSQLDALKYLNWLAIPENYKFLQNGTLGVHHDLENGVPKLRPNVANDPWYFNSPNNIDMTLPMNGVELGNQADNSKVLALGYTGTPPATIVNAYSISVKNARGPIVKQITLDKVQNTQTLQDKAKSLLSQAIRCPPAQFNTIWDQGYKDWLASGAQEMIDERTAKWK